MKNITAIKKIARTFNTPIPGKLVAGTVYPVAQDNGYVVTEIDGEFRTLFYAVTASGVERRMTHPLNKRKHSTGMIFHADGIMFVLSENFRTHNIYAAKTHAEFEAMNALNGF